MKVGDKIIIRKRIHLPNAKGRIVSQIPGTNLSKYIIEINYVRPILATLEKSEFSRCRGQEILLNNFCITEGCIGVVVQELPHSHYLCEFAGPPCDVELAKDEIIAWDPHAKVFALLNTVRVIKDIPEHGLKKGMEGVVVFVFFDPCLAYHVDFFLGEDSAEKWDSYTLLPHQIEFVADRP